MQIFFDLDKTLLQENSSFAFCRYLYQQDILKRRDLLFCTVLYLSHLYLGLSFWTLHSLTLKRIFKGKVISELETFLPSFLPTLEWYEPALIRLHQLRGDGHEVYILSNSPHFLVKPIAASVGVSHVVATEYKIDKGGYLCDIANLVDGEKKAQFVNRFEGETVAFSDSHHDLPFLEAASRAIAVNPNKRLAAIATKRSWEVI